MFFAGMLRGNAPEQEGAGMLQWEWNFLAGMLRLQHSREKYGARKGTWTRPDYLMNSCAVE